VRCPNLSELPPPPPGRQGWPWTEGTLTRSGGGAAPSIAVVVPSYQQGAFLEETLRSVLLQGYPDLELLVMDGGSRDGSVDVIRKYERWIKAWVSEPDGGQTAAINKGWRQATATLITWLNSDDILFPGWATQMSAPMAAKPSLDFAYCDVQVIDHASCVQWLYAGKAPDLEQMLLLWKVPFAQQGFLMRRQLLETRGYLDEKLHFTMDAEYWLRLTLAGCTFHHVAAPLAGFRVHGAAKTSTQHEAHVNDMLDVTSRFCRTAPPGLAGLAARAQRRMYWNAAHIKYDNRQHAAARQYALRHLRHGGLDAIPRVGAMVALSFLGAPGHRLLELSRRLRAPGP
jgi:GT2 family glycosyltransferase